MRLSANRCSLFSLFAATALSLFLAGCASLSLNNSDSSGASAFDQALSKNYQGLADSFATATAEHSSGFFSSPLSYLGITSPDEQSPTEMLAKLFADKAQLAAGGKDVAPEPATNSTLEMMRARLVRAVDAGKDRFPEDAARAQADYDCWVVNTGIASQSAAAFQCHTSFNRSLGRLEAQLAPAPPPPVATAPAAPAAVSGAPSDYTVYFDFDSWSLSAQDLAVSLTSSIRRGRAAKRASPSSGIPTPRARQPTISGSPSVAPMWWSKPWSIWARGARRSQRRVSANAISRCKRVTA